MTIPLAATVAEVRAVVATARAAGQRIGFVPTMGALHAGHARLIECARQECGFVVVSIFVNPTQFGPNEDFARYPRTLDADRQVCAAAGADLIFAPAVEEVYPPGMATVVEVNGLTEGLCGAARPGHFRGVTTVVLKLLLMVGPDAAYFGHKDAQQLRVIERMVEDLNVPVRIVPVETVREADGLALSSRNQYLTPEQRSAAVALSRGLTEVRERAEAGERDAARLRKLLVERMAATPGARLDYAEIVDVETLRPVERLDRPVLVALAVHFGSTRLIDNVRIEV
jgi:pantoate--beta-alanine ligase